MTFETLVQLGLAVFGLAATWLGFGRDDRLRRWGPLIGLCGQVFWVLFCVQAARAGVNVGGLAVIVFAYTVVYARGVRVQWNLSLFDFGLVTLGALGVQLAALLAFGLIVGLPGVAP